MTDLESSRADTGTETDTPAFIAPVAMENDPDALFAGDRGVLDADVRRVLVRILQRRFLLAESSRRSGSCCSPTSRRSSRG